MAVTNINFRVDEDLKRDAESICQEIGMNMTTAITIFLKRMVREKGIPFDVTLNVPNATTLRAFKELEEGGGKSFSSLEELMEDLND